MVREADLHAEEDRKRKAAIEARNQLDSLIYNTEKTIRENREKLPSDQVSQVEAAVVEAKETMKSEDEGVLKQAAETLMRSAQGLAEFMYKDAAAKAQTSPPPEGEGAASGQQGEVIDAEYEDPAKK